MTFEETRLTYPCFTYEKFDVIEQPQDWVITFYFNLNNSFFFEPTISLPKIKFDKPDLSKNWVKNILFNMGMVEMVSYWKATCSPQVLIKAGFLDNGQISWWKKLYFHGLGEFFYLNHINTTIDDFMHLTSSEEAPVFEKETIKVKEQHLIPIGGGKDSIVTLDLLKTLKNENNLFIINPRGATLETCSAAQYSDDKIITVQRKIHPTLLQLNAAGFLNGHTPFSAMLAFTALFVAANKGIKYIVLSNEESANESTVEGTMINHQYSKSFEFETDFKAYVDQYITEDIHYFSLLRRYNEYTITELFSKLNQYHTIFKSCNVGSKENKWCAHCAKCLFVYIMLSAHLSQEQLENIFGHNLLDNPLLEKEFDELTGITAVKPFECVGTVSEVNTALTILSQQETHQMYLLDRWKKYNKRCSEKEVMQITSFRNNNHLIPSKFLPFLN